MFGLMKYTGSCLPRDARRAQQTRYCGTCKSMGRLFGQSARATLNHDAVFLGELLLALEPAPLSAPAFTPRRCFILPKADEIPPALAYAAAANVVLAEFAVCDQILDGDRRWWAIQKPLARSFRAARAHLHQVGLPLDALFAQQQRQAQYERQARAPLAYFAEPTGEATRLVFSHGAPAFAEPLGLLGEAFGRLIYVLDAIQDQAKDAKTGAFNALAASQSSIADARRYVREQQARFGEALQALPLPPAERESFALRLRASVNHALMSTQLPQGERSGSSRPADKKQRRFPQNRCGNCLSDCWDALCCCDDALCFCDDATRCCSGSKCECCGCSACHT